MMQTQLEETAAAADSLSQTSIPEYHSVELHSGKVYCANCIHCKLIPAKADNGDYYVLRIRCSAGKWKKKLGEEKLYKYNTIIRQGERIKKYNKGGIIYAIINKQFSWRENMEVKTVAPLADYFKNIEDPRIDRKKLYPLNEVILITILAFMSLAEGWEDIEDFGNAKESWLRSLLKLEHGIPKHDVYRRVFVRLKPEQLEKCFMDWIKDMRIPVNREVIAVDGKTIRGSASTFECLKAAHVVSAWAQENRMVLAQVKTDEKSNEITAIPELLAMFALKGAIITIDAMGCQYKIANQIIKAEADYLFSLKGNQETLHDDVEEYFKDINFEKPEARIKVTTTHDVDHGRIERRAHAITDNVDWLIARHPAWNSIKSIAVIEGMRDINGVVSIERRYYVSSLPADPELLAFAARAHWGIENSLHYILDVAFREDACTIKRGNSPQNLNVIRKIALTLVRSDKESKKSIRKRLKLLAWSNEYFEKLLFRSDLAWITGQLNQASGQF
jgi:predicted transposase YbfD/YdcC